MKKFVNVVATIGAILLFWIFASWVDVNNHNNVFDDDYHNYASWNFFEIVPNFFWGEE
jgi:hypothetical protein